ncbi:hypothetical protein CS8_061570 [Cupriavidus sp. 8B]
MPRNHVGVSGRQGPGRHFKCRPNTLPSQAWHRPIDPAARRNHQICAATGLPFLHLAAGCAAPGTPAFTGTVSLQLGFPLYSVKPGVRPPAHLPVMAGKAI